MHDLLSRVRNSLVLISILTSLIFAETPSLQADSLLTRKSEYLKSGNDSLHIIIYKNLKVAKDPVLLISLHGDYNHPGYHYKFARLLAERDSNLISVGILRPGYTDEMGNTSSGIMGIRSGDNYTKDVIDLIASAIKKLKASFGADKVIIAGHSGGAAITADLIGLYPKLAGCVVLVSCPCILDEWRSHMYKMTGDSIWRVPVKSISPSDVITSIDPETKIFLFEGENDQVVPSEITEQYAGLLERRTLKPNLIKLPSKGHDIFLEEEVLKKIVEIIRQYH